MDCLHRPHESSFLDIWKDITLHYISEVVQLLHWNSPSQKILNPDASVECCMFSCTLQPGSLKDSMIYHMINNCDPYLIRDHRSGSSSFSSSLCACHSPLSTNLPSFIHIHIHIYLSIYIYIIELKKWGAIPFNLLAQIKIFSCFEVCLKCAAKVVFCRWWTLTE